VALARLFPRLVLQNKTALMSMMGVGAMLASARETMAAGPEEGEVGDDDAETENKPLERSARVKKRSKKSKKRKRARKLERSDDTDDEDGFDAKRVCSVLPTLTMVV